MRVFGSYASSHVLALYVPDKLMAREIAYQICGDGGLKKELKDKKKTIWPQFLVSCGAFSLFDVGHVFKEVKNITCLQLFNFPRRLFDPYDAIKNFTTTVKVRIFSGEEDLFDDMCQEKCTFK